MYRSTAWTLAERGLTTIAMHFEQPDAAGLLLGDAFWRAVARHDPIDACLVHTREVLVSSLTEDRPEWGNGALIMQLHDGALLACPRDIERANYLRVLERRSLGDVDENSADVVVRLLGTAGDVETQLGDALAGQPRMILQIKDVEKTSAQLIRWVRTAEACGTLKPGTLPILIRLDRWALFPDNLSNFLASSMRDLGFSSDFSDVLLQHVRDGCAVLIFQAPDVGDVSPEAIRWIADLVSGIAHSSRLLVVLRQGEDIAALRRAGFTIATVGRDQDAAPPLDIRVWVKPTAFSQKRDILVMPRRTRARYRVGDEITVHFWANADCYLTLVNYGTSGAVHTLFPNDIHANPYVAGNVVHQIPDPAHEFVFRLSGPPGVERIRAIATREPMGGLHASAVQSGTLFAQRTVRDIEVLSHAAQAVNRADRAEAECEVEVEP